MDSIKTGLLIREARKQKGLTQKQLAQQLHVSDRTVSKWERGAGLPDIALLEPLSDALELPVQSLLRGEAAAEPAAEDALRAAVRLLLEESRRVLRRSLSQILASMLMLAFLGLFIFAALDAGGAFLKQVRLEVPATLYQDGTAVGETVVTIDGTLQTLYEPSFQGTFAMPEAPGSAVPQVSAFIEWDSPEDGYQSITFSRPGISGVDGGIERYLYISPDMTQFALTLADGRVVATNEGLAALQAIGRYRYALDYDGYPLFGYLEH